MRVAAIQMRSTTSLDSNVETLRAAVSDAASQGAVYIQSPEMTGLIQKDRKSLFAEICAQDEDPVFAAASDLAREYGIWLHIGSTPVKVGAEKAANRAALFNPNGALVASYDKIHMFDVDLDSGESWRESSVYAPGKYAVTAMVGDAKLGFGICYDMRFPQLYATLAKSGAQILTAPAAFTVQTGRAHWHTLLRARAIENGAFVIAAAQGGTHEDGRETYGHSLIVNPWGEIIAEKTDDRPGVIIADIDLGQSTAARAKIPNLANQTPFELVENKQ